ncbi:hypothetical protein [Chitinilyticum piscinae]|uniref:Uncharacterized protein n=1 Tax=Chitinilyticum piscinae TaxID=2866724 RepID=A0A8J7FMV7_9NEIS|nr:hypothetical protein [Chitinilyticum piscinae]MBE9609496.1 hypothetical protein [Chitinilyticum piscinae]
MNTVCPKCSYTRMAGDAAHEWQCPSCGIAYAKYSANVATGAVGDVQKKPLLLCKKYVIAKSKLLQITETTGAVLLTEDAIYLARKSGVAPATGFGGVLGAAIGHSQLGVIGGLLGGAIGGAIVGAAAMLIENTMTKPRLKAAGAVSLEQLPSEIISSLAGYGCSGEVVVLPRQSLKKIEVSMSKGVYLKNETHLFELRLGLLDFTKAREKLSLYQWL